MQVCFVPNCTSLHCQAWWQHHTMLATDRWLGKHSDALEAFFTDLKFAIIVRPQVEIGIAEQNWNWSATMKYTYKKNIMSSKLQIWEMNAHDKKMVLH